VESDTGEQAMTYRSYRFMFDAAGRPRSKGSHLAQRRHGGGVRVAPVGEDALTEWTATLRHEASLALVSARKWGAWPADLWRGPVLVVAAYRLALPQRLAGELTVDEPATVTPDGDKLERALWDALTGLAFADDRQVVGWAGSKRYANPLERPGVSCMVRTVPLDGAAELALWTRRIWEMT
jgi:Endodeoxyribonuclease RusA